jgi:hypothetical protein
MLYKHEGYSIKIDRDVIKVLGYTPYYRKYEGADTNGMRKVAVNQTMRLITNGELPKLKGLRR